jgi:site-specific DNA-methyltransferase (adenine-specific)
MKPVCRLSKPDTRIYLGDCRQVMPQLKLRGKVDLIFADPPFNWDVDYGTWDDAIPREKYLEFTTDWIRTAVDLLAPHGSIWINIADDTAAEIVVYAKALGLTMVNWCIWHYRFGQNRTTNFIVSKVHALYFCKDPNQRIWHPEEVMEASDRASKYGDKRTWKKTAHAGVRVPFDVWHGPGFCRVQGNNAERRGHHKNQLPEAYLNRVIRATSNPDSLILDPFLGSGTTCIVARALGRRSIGIELDNVSAASAISHIRAGSTKLLKTPAQPKRQLATI